MLGKLFKYEFKYTYKLMLVIYLVVAGLTAIGAVSIKTKAMAGFDNEAIEGIVLMVYFLAYTLSLMALPVVTYIYMCKRFYDTTYSARGYLTHTLPVKRSSIFNVKLAVSAFWMVLSVAVLLLSIFLLISPLEIPDDIWAEMGVEFTKVMGVGTGEFIGIMIVSAIISCLYSLLMIYTAMGIGQMFENRIGASIIAGIAIYFGKGILSGILSMIWGISIFASSVNSGEMVFGRGQYYVSMVFEILVVIGLYAANQIILQKKLNLE